MGTEQLTRRPKPRNKWLLTSHSFAHYASALVQFGISQQVSHVSRLWVREQLHCAYLLGSHLASLSVGDLLQLERSCGCAHSEVAAHVFRAPGGPKLLPSNSTGTRANDRLRSVTASPQAYLAARFRVHKESVVYVLVLSPVMIFTPSSVTAAATDGYVVCILVRLSGPDSGLHKPVSWLNFTLCRDMLFPYT